MRASKSNIALRVGGILLVMSLLFPPWAYTYSSSSGNSHRRPAGYGLLFDPPSPTTRFLAAGIVLDWSRLTAQIGVIALLTGGVWFPRRDADQSGEAD